jgi:hypothetical protein
MTPIIIILSLLVLFNLMMIVVILITQNRAIHVIRNRANELFDKLLEQYELLEKDKHE